MDTRTDGMPDAYSQSQSSTASGVAWPAIIGGAFAATGLTLVLSPLGAALGFAWISPWNYSGETGRAFTITAAIWLIIVQWLAAGLGGYLTGRLRTKWPAHVHTHEVFFRDTVHGFLSWALASVAAAVFLASLASHISGEARMHHDGAAPYLSSSLFRGAPPANVTDQDRLESRHIISMGAVNGEIPDEDRSYLMQLVTSRTKIAPVEAETRIDNALAREKAEIKNVSKASFFICLSLLIGAFVASAAGALGGIHRDVHFETGKLGP